MRLDEITGDPKFDSMMGKMASGEAPQGHLRAEPPAITRRTREITHKIFMLIRAYDDPSITAKFTEFMNQTLDPSIGDVS